MLRFLMVLMLLSKLNFVYSQTITRTFSKTINIETDVLYINENEKLNLELRTTKGSRIICELTVKINTTEPILDALTKSGRYDDILLINNNSTESTLDFNKNKNTIIVRGTQINEEFSILLFIPEKINVIKNSL